MLVVYIGKSFSSVLENFTTVLSLLKTFTQLVSRQKLWILNFSFVVFEQCQHTEGFTSDTLLLFTLPLKNILKIRIFLVHNKNWKWLDMWSGLF